MIRNNSTKIVTNEDQFGTPTSLSSVSSPSLTEKNCFREEGYDSISIHQISAELELNENRITKQENVDDTLSITNENKSFSFTNLCSSPLTPISSSTSLQHISSSLDYSTRFGHSPVGKKLKSSFNLKKKQDVKLNKINGNHRKINDFNYANGSFYCGIASNILSPIKKLPILDSSFLTQQYFTVPSISIPSNDQQNYIFNQILTSLQNNNSLNRSIYSLSNQYDNQFTLSNIHKTNLNSNQNIDKSNNNLLKPFYPIMVYR